MKRPLIAPALAFFLLASEGLAQNSDWQIVKGLHFGAHISVKTTHRSLHDPCVFQQATDDGLVCLYATHSQWVPPSTISFRRSDIREVRLERSDAANIAVGAGIGAGTGAALGGAVAPSGRKAGTAAGLGVIGSVIGGWFGLEFPILHGPVTYRATSGKPKNAPKHEAAKRASVELREDRTRRP